MKRSPDFFVVDDASLVVAASQFALCEECVEGLAAWHEWELRAENSGSGERASRILTGASCRAPSQKEGPLI
jgi:hypothetical protein